MNVLRLDVEGDVELALLDALVEPRGAEDEAAQPVHERAVGSGRPARASSR